MKGELYELIGWGWRFPIIVELLTGGDLCQVDIADIPTLKRQREAVVKLLQTHKRHREGNRWYFTPVDLAKVAQKSNAKDPEDVVQWKIDETDTLIKSDFILAYVESPDSIPAIRSTVKFAMIWDSIRKHMFNWLLVHEKPLDLGFCTINAFPARANWKNCVIGRHVARSHNIPIGSSEQNRRDIRRMLHQNFVTAFNSESLLANWSLDITPTRIFHDIIEAREQKRLLKSKGDYWKYAWQILRLLKDATIKNRMYESLLAYSKEAQRPIAKLPHGFVPGSESEGKKPEIDAQSIDSWLQTPVVIGKKMEDRSASVVVPKNEGVHAVPDLQPSDEDLRNAGIEMDAAGPDDDGASGLPVLAAGEEPTGSELLEDRPDRGDSRLAGGVE